MKSRLVLLKNTIRRNSADEKTEGSYKMYGYYVEQLRTYLGGAQIAWEDAKKQLEEVYALDHTSRACKKRITQTSNSVEAWFKRVESLMNRLPKDKQPSSAVLAEIRKELGLKHLNTFSGLSCTVSTLPIGKDRKEAIMIVVRSITDNYRTNMEETRQALVDYMEET